MTDGLRFQSGLGTNFTRRYKEGQQINTLLLAQVINVNYKYNTVDLMSLQHKEVFQNSYANEGKFSAKLPIEFGGRNIAGQPYGQINPIAVGNIVLVGFINADKNMPIVLSVYNDGTVSNKLTQAPFANADPTDEELQRHTYQKFQVYPSLTYDGIDGEGTRVASFSGKSFFLVSASEERDSGTTDAGYGTNYEDLATSYYNDGELIEPMVPMAPTILFNHQGIEDEDGNEDTHKLLFHIERDGTYRTSMLDKTADWRTFFEMKPDGGVRLRRQGDSIRIDDGFEVGEIGISSDGRVYLRNGDTDLEVRADGLYSNGAPLSVDLSSIYEKLEQQDGKLVSMSTSIIKTDEKVQILADKTEYYDDKIVDYDSSFTVMAEMIESKVTATEVQDMIDGAVTDFTGEIAKVQADADRANQVISDMASDNRVTPSEKNQLLTEWDLIQNEYPTYIAQAEVYEVSTASYTAKYNAVKAFVEPILADMTATSVVDGTLMRKTFGAYYTERTALLTAILKDLKDGLVEAMQKASQASIDAGEAKADATQATIDANRANSLIADIASDGKLTASEKSQLKKEWNIVLKEYPTTLAQANKYEISTADYTAKYTALQTFVTPLLADMSTTSVVDGDQLRAVFANYYDVRVKLLRSISDSAKDDLLDYGQRIYVAETKITQTSESITLLATKVQSIEDDVLTNTAELKIQAELISQKVTASEVKNVVDSAINDMTIGTSNLYVIYTQTAGLLSETDGTVKTAVDDSVVSDYIKVKPSSPYVASVFDNTGSNTIIVAWYDTNKAFISGQAVAGSNDFSQAYKSPSNAVYARVSYKKSKTVKMKFESGTKGSDFSYSWADVKNDQTLLEQYVKDVQEEAQQAQADAENAKNQADNANQAINDMSNDNVLTPLEKQQVLLQWEEIQAEYSKNIDQASKFNVSSTLYASAYSALSTYLTPILADLTSKSIIIGSTMRANFKTYYDRRTTLLNAVAEKAKTLADNAQSVADKADSDLNNIGGYNYVGFSSGDNMLPRLMIDNVGYYEVSACKATFEGDMVALTPTTAGGSTAWYYNIGTSSSTVALNGLSSYRLGDVEVGKWLTATVNLKVTGTGSAEARLYLLNGGSWTTVSSDKVTASQGNKRVTVQAQVQSNTTAVLIRIYTSTPATVSKILFNKVQLEVGIRPTPWKKSDIDIQEDINNVAKELEGSIGNAVSIAEQAQADAVKAQETADSAVTNASKANSAIADMANDNLITPSEKLDIKKEWEVILAEKPINDAQAVKFGVASADYTAKYNALSTYITPILTSLTTNSVVVGQTMRDTFKAYYTARTTLLNAVATKAKELADRAQSTVDGLEIGGRNLQVGTFDFPTTAFRSLPSTTVVTKEATGSWVEVVTGVTTTELNFVDIGENQQFTVSFDCMTTNTTINGTQMMLVQYFNSSGTRINYEWVYGSYGNSWKRFNLTSTTPTGTTKIGLGLRSTSNSLRYRLVKLELGNKATAWTPALEDAQLYTAYSNSSNGEKDFTRNYPNENLLVRKGELVQRIVDASGNITEYANNNTSIVLIPVTPNEVLYFSQSLKPTSTVGFRWRWLTSNETYISRGADVSNQKFTLTVPSNASYLQVSYSSLWDSKVERNSYSVILPSPQDDPVKAEMAYIGYSPKDSNDPSDYVWIENPKATSLYTAWSNKEDGSEDFTRNYPTPNLLFDSKLTNLSNWSVNSYLNGVSNGDGTATLNKTETTTSRSFFSSATRYNPEAKSSTMYSFAIDIKFDSNCTGIVGSSVFLRETKNGSNLRDFAAVNLTDSVEKGKWVTYIASGTTSSDIDSVQFTLAMANGMLGTFHVRKPKVTFGSTALPFSVMATDDPIKAEMAYIGYSVKDSNNPADYIWSENPKAKGTFKRWANSPDGTVDFTAVYPNENLLRTTTSVSTIVGMGQSNQTDARTNYTLLTTPFNTLWAGMKVGDTFTFSCDVNISGTGFAGQFRTQTHMNPYVGMGAYYNVTKAETVRVSFTGTVTQALIDSTTVTMIQIRYDNVPTTVSIKVSKPKLERGSVATPYTTNREEDLLLQIPQYVGIGSKDTMNPADFVWTQNTDYMTAVTEQALNGKEGSWIYSPTEPSNPAVGVMWVDSSVVPNQPKRWTGAETGWVALTPEEASDIPWGEDGSSLADWVAQAEQRISADSIINTVLGSEDFTGIFDTKADTEDLTNLASYDDLASMQEEYQRLLQEGIDGIDFSPYVKNSELEQLKDSFNFTIQQAGGVNMLRNSLGFSGEDFWNGGTSGNLLLNTGTMTSRIVGASTVDTANSYNGNTTIKATWSSGTVDPYRQKTANTPRDGQYTITFWAKADRTLTFNNYFYSTGTTTSSVNSDGKTGTSSDGLSQLTATTAWKRYWITWDSKSATTVKEVLLGRLFGTGTIWINSPMLVEGTTPVDWAPAPTDAGATSLSAFETTQNDDLANLGFGSGFLLDHKAGGALKQSVTLPEAKAGLYYAVSFYMNIASTTTGVTAGIKVYEDGKQSYIVGHTDASKVSPNGYQRYYLIYEPSSVNTEIEIFVTGASNTTVVISGIMFNIGNVALKWQPYPSEIYNTNVKIDINGITVKNNQTDGYTMITPQEFSGYARVDGEMERIFTLNGETTEVRMLKAEQRITMLPIAIFAMENSVNRGWAFVSSSAT